MRSKDQQKSKRKIIQNRGMTSNDIKSGNLAYQNGSRDKLEVTDIRMLRFMFGVTRHDSIRNEKIGATNFVELSKKLLQRKLQW